MRYGLRHLSDTLPTLTVFVILLTILPSATSSSKNLDHLKSFSRTCFSNVKPCVLFADHLGSYGCAQCNSLVQNTVREFVTRAELFNFLTTTDRRTIMLPEYLFFDQAVLSTLSTANNVDSVVVYPGDSPNIIPTYQPNESFPSPPLRSLSVDLVEPNVRNNFYFNVSSDKPWFLEPDFNVITSQISDPRNQYGSSTKFLFFPFTIFHVSVQVAERIRNYTHRLANIPPGTPVGTKSFYSIFNDRSLFTPRYELQSVGRMYMCSSTPAATPKAKQADDEVTVVHPLSAVTSSKCLEDRTCLPIGGQSIWSAMTRLHQTEKKTMRILAITAPLDSMAFFPDASLGASAEIASIAVLLALVQAVSEFWRHAEREKQIYWLPVFFAFNAQSWGYAGSSRFLNDTMFFKCNSSHEDILSNPQCDSPFMSSVKFLRLRNAEYTVLNIGQLITPRWYEGLKEGDTLQFTASQFISDKVNDSCVCSHSNYSDGNRVLQKNGEDRCIRQILLDVGNIPSENPGEMSVGVTNGVNTRIPLDASQSFFRYASCSDMVSLQYAADNRYFHSSFDNATLTTSSLLRSKNASNGDEGRHPLYAAARILAKTVLEKAFQETDYEPKINSSLIDGVLTCLTGNWTKCDLAREYLPNNLSDWRKGSIRPGNYAGSFFPATRLEVSHPTWAMKIAFIRSFLSYHNRYDNDEKGLRDCEKVEDCEDYRRKMNENVTSRLDLHTVYCSRGKCVLSDTYLHDAFGTGIIPQNQHRSIFAAKDTTNISFSDPAEGMWTESAWTEDFGLCAVVKDTDAFGAAILIVGLLLFLLYVVALRYVDKLLFSGMRDVGEEGIPLSHYIAEPP